MKRIARGRRWTLICGEAVAVISRQADAAFDALVTDPPYSSGGFTRGDRTLPARTKYSQARKLIVPDFDGDNRDQRGFLAWSSIWLTDAYRLVRRGGAACVFSDWRQLPVMSDAFQAGGFVWRGVAVWTKKNGSRPQLGRYRQDSEFVIWGSKGPMQHRGQGALRGTWSCSPVGHAKRVHLTEKPVAVMEEVVLIAPRGGVVLDPFAGSGSTGVACLRTGRSFVGVERDATIFASACDRLADEERAASERRAA